jgi:hypothetical protein
MRGESVDVESRVGSGLDELNNQAYTYAVTNVSDVLVSPGPRADIIESNRPDGHLVKWTLYFPKSYTSELEGCRVKVRGEWYRVVGSPGRYPDANTPGKWDMPVEVEVDHG